MVAEKTNQEKEDWVRLAISSFLQEEGEEEEEEETDEEEGGEVHPSLRRTLTYWVM